MNILVAGGEGFLGRALVQKLKEMGHCPISIDFKNCDLSDPGAIEFLLSIPSDFVFHLAGKTGIGQSWKEPASFYRANCDTTRHLLEYCRLKTVPIHYVSAYVYGDQGSAPISEETSPAPNTPYAHSKWMGEELCRFYQKAYSVETTLSRPFNIYGPAQSPSFFIPRMIEQLRNSSSVKTLSLDAKRDYVFVEDAADALIQIMQRGKVGECYNIGTGAAYSCREVIELLQKLIGVEKPIVVSSPTTQDPIPHAQADNQKIFRDTGWRPAHSLAEGLIKSL